MGCCDDPTQIRGSRQCANCGGNFFSDAWEGFKTGARAVAAPLRLLSKVPGINAVAGPISGAVDMIAGGEMEGGFGTRAGAAKNEWIKTLRSVAAEHKVRYNDVMRDPALMQFARVRHHGGPPPPVKPRKPKGVRRYLQVGWPNMNNEQKAAQRAIWAQQQPIVRAPRVKKERKQPLVSGPLPLPHFPTAPDYPLPPVPNVPAYGERKRAPAVKVETLDMEPEEEIDPSLLPPPPSIPQFVPPAPPIFHAPASRAPRAPLLKGRRKRRASTVEPLGAFGFAPADISVSLRKEYPEEPHVAKEARGSGFQKRRKSGGSLYNDFVNG